MDGRSIGDNEKQKGYSMITVGEEAAGVLFQCMYAIVLKVITNASLDILEREHHDPADFRTRKIKS